MLQVSRVMSVMLLRFTIYSFQSCNVHSVVNGSDDVCRMPMEKCSGPLCSCLSVNIILPFAFVEMWTNANAFAGQPADVNLPAVQSTGDCCSVPVQDPIRIED